MASTRLHPLSIRLLADKSGGDEARYADLPGAPPGTWPRAGVTVVGDPPPATRVPTSWVQRGKREGWIEVENERPVHRPGGPVGDEWSITHTFLHADVIVLKTVDGDLRYRVTHQPDKYADYGQATYPDQVGAFDGDDDTPVTDEVYAAGATRVDWFYDLALEG